MIASQQEQHTTQRNQFYDFNKCAIIDFKIDY